jgi:heat shock protein HslJ
LDFDLMINPDRTCFAIAAALAASTAGAAAPIFAAKCPNGPSVGADARGRVYVDGKLASTIARPDGQVTARSAGLYVDITPRGSQPPRVTFTARDKSVAECEVVSFRAPDGAGPAGSAAIGKLASTRWRLVEFQSMDNAIGTLRPHDPSQYLMRLNADGTVTMQLNCNRATGTWKAEPAADGASGRFEFGPLATTRALCPAPSMDERIAADSRYVRGYLLKDGRLHLSLMADAGIYAWEPDPAASTAASVPAAPDDGGPRNWEVIGTSGTVNLREQPSTAARIVARLKPGAILDNLGGCQRAGDGIWCDAQTLGGGPRGFVSAESLKPAISPDGSARTGPDDSALRAGQGKFDATGPLPCAQYAGQPMGECTFGVARAGGGYATVVVTHPDGHKRAIYFRMGRPIGADTSQADGYPEFRATRERDLHLIRIGNERYEIPDAVVLGG